MHIYITRRYAQSKRNPNGCKIDFQLIGNTLTKIFKLVKLYLTDKELESFTVVIK